MANKLNMAIAKTHRLSSRVVGMQLTGGTFIGIALSAVQMSAGFLVIGQGIIKGNWFIAIFVGVVGILLAVMIERLSLGGLAAVRVAKEYLKNLEKGYFRLTEPTEQQTKHYEERKQALKRDRKVGWFFGGVGMILSAGIGDVFWHTIFAPLEPHWLGYVLSVACAAVIGLNFVHAELFKALMDTVLKEILADFSLMKTAVAAEEQNMQLDMMVDAYESVQADSSVREPAENKIRKTIGRRLTGFAGQISAAADQVAAMNAGGTIIEAEVNYLSTNAPLALPAPRGKYVQHRDELIRLYRANPGLSQGDIAKHFNVSKSTANSWHQKLKVGA